MFVIETNEQFEQALEQIVSAQTTLDRQAVIDVVKRSIVGHPMEVLATRLLDGLCTSCHNLGDRLAATAELKAILLDAPTQERVVAQNEHIEYLEEMRKDAAGPISGPPADNAEELEANRAEVIRAAAIEGERPEPPSGCNVADVTRGNCTLAAGHDGAHAWEFPEQIPAPPQAV